ncbi:MAG: glycosyltransferase family 2 protein [Elusimicrobiota bacterium]
MRLSVVIPAHNEEGSLEETVLGFYRTLARESIDHEIVVVDDHSSDGTAALLSRLAIEIPTLRPAANEFLPGFGRAVETGLNAAAGDAVAICMADGSDSPEDLIVFFRTMERENVDCVFGTRFAPESKIIDYPFPKLAINRIANTFIRLIFRISYNDVTNAFKLYRRGVIQGVGPILSRHFNLTVELPLKAIVRGYSYAVVPNSWTNRRTGESKLKIREMGSRYLFIVIYCLIEKWLSRGDYLKKA